MASDLSWAADRMAKFVDLTPRRLAQLVQEGVITKVEKGRYNPFEVTVAYIRWLRDQRSAVSGDREKIRDGATIDRARRTRAEADLKELERGRQIRTLCYRDDYKDNYADGIAQGTRNISRLKELTSTQKELVFAALRAVKLAELETGE